MVSGCCACRGRRDATEKPKTPAATKLTKQPVTAAVKLAKQPAVAAVVAAVAAPAFGAGSRGGGAAGGGPPQPKQLLRAAKDDDAARVAELLDAGLDIEHKGMWGNTPLLCACAYGCAEVADVLVTRGADCTVLNDDGASPLMLACMEGLERAALGMLAKGGVALWPAAASVYNQVVDSSESQTPLRVACQNGRVRLVRALLDQGVLASAPDAVAVGSALVAAARHGREEVVEMLLAAGIAADSADKAGATAAQVGTVEVKDLIAARTKASSRKHPAPEPAPAAKEDVQGPEPPVEAAAEEVTATLNSARAPEPVGRLAPLEGAGAARLPPLAPQPPSNAKAPLAGSRLPPLAGSLQVPVLA